MSHKINTSIFCPSSFLFLFLNLLLLRRINCTREFEVHEMSRDTITIEHMDTNFEEILVGFWIRNIGTQQDLPLQIVPGESGLIKSSFDLLNPSSFSKDYNVQKNMNHVFSGLAGNNRWFYLIINFEYSGSSRLERI